MTGLGFDNPGPVTRNFPLLGKPQFAGQAGNVVSIEMVGLDDVLRSFSSLERDLKRTANGELRAGAKKIADRLVQKLHKAGSVTPQGPAAGKTARAKSDRTVKVKLGAVGIPFQRGKITGKRAVAVTYGANYGPLGEVNYYKAPRNAAGYWIEPTVKPMEQQALRDYENLLVRMMRKYGLV